MGKKGAKRKTRWRTLSIGTPPGEEDEEDGSRNGSRSGQSESQPQAEQRSNGYAGSRLKSRHGSAGSAGSSGNGSTSNGQSGPGSTTSGYSSRSRRDDSATSLQQPSPQQQQQTPSEPKIKFNEEEYTRITTPRQDMLFKKNYFLQKKRYRSTSMSGTPSTAESRSASHSTADGSEAAEDQQLLDCNGGSIPAGEMVVPMIEAQAHPIGYSTFYDHHSCVYYDVPCPMMLVGPAVPDPHVHEVLAAMPCGSVPLRRIEWVDPQMMTKVPPFCYMTAATAPGNDCAALVDAQGLPLSMAEPPDATMTNGLSSEVPLTNSASASGSLSAAGSLADEDGLACPIVNGLACPVNGMACVVDEPEQQLVPIDQQLVPIEQQPLDATAVVAHDMTEQIEYMASMEPVEEPMIDELATFAGEPLEHPTESSEHLQREELQRIQQMEARIDALNPNEGPEYDVEPMAYIHTLPPQPVHLAHTIVAQPMAQPGYIYSGSYMYGHPVANVNGVTIQNGPMPRYNDMMMNAAAAACVKRRKKKKKKKQKRSTGSVDEDGEESSEGESSPSRAAWLPSGGATTVMTTTTSTTTTTGSSSSTCRPLNPECQEFRLRSPKYRPFVNNDHLADPNAMYSSSAPLAIASNGNGVEYHQDYVTQSYVPATLNNHANNEITRLNDEELQTAYPTSNGQVGLAPSDYEQAAGVVYYTNGDEYAEAVQNGDYQELGVQYHTVPEISDNQYAWTAAVSNSNGLADRPKLNYSAKVFTLRRELTPEIEQVDPVVEASTTTMTTMLPIDARDDESSVDNVTAMLSSATLADAQPVQNDGDLDICQRRLKESSITSESCCNDAVTTTTTTATTRAATDEDSGIGSQTKLSGSLLDRPISSAVFAWIKGNNSPDLFREDVFRALSSSSTATSDAEVDDDDDVTDDDDDYDEPPRDARGKSKPPKNLQGNPMPALSCNGNAAKRRHSRGQFASPDDLVPSRKNRNLKGAKSFKRTDDDVDENQVNKHAKALNYYYSVETIFISKSSDSAIKGKVDEACELTDKDSDAGMRVAEKSRNNVIDVIANEAQEGGCRRRRVGGVKLPVKTFEKGEIVVSMDGGLLLEPLLVEDRKNFKRKKSNSTTSDGTEYSLGSIEEPELLEYWDKETVEPHEPQVISKRNLEENRNQVEWADENLNFLVTRDNSSDRMKHVQKYYRLQADSSATSIEDNAYDNNVLNDNSSTSTSVIVPNNADLTTESSGSIEEFPISVGDDGSSIPIEEALEAHESNNDRSFPSVIRLIGRNDEGAVPCKVMCCNIQ